MKQTLNESLLQKFNNTEGVKEKIAEVTKQLESGEITSFQASEQILSYYYERK